MPSQPDFRPIGDYALIGDCRTTALVASSGSIDWCCVPRFDGGSVFARLLDPRGGHFALAPVDAGEYESDRSYVDDTMVLRTRFERASGSATVTDLLAIPDPDAAQDRRCLIRIVDGLRGEVEFDLDLVPRYDYGDVRPWIRGYGERLHTIVGGDDALIFASDVPVTQPDQYALEGRFAVHDGERIRFALTYVAPETIGEEPMGPGDDELDADLERTLAFWREWSSRIDVREGEGMDVRRSALALKALTYEPTGAIVAAPTTSLPEAIPGERNWDYRYSWVRDASYSSRAFAEIGCSSESDGFRRFIFRSAAGHAEDLQIVYGIGGERRIGLTSETNLKGYRDTGPVRIGNSAAFQQQLDSFGEIVNLSWRWHRRGHSPDDDDWRFLVSLIDLAAERCTEPDQGFWEWPGDPLHFVHSKVICWSALDRGVRMAQECMRKAPERRWRKVRDELRQTIESRGYDEARGVFTQIYDDPGMDSALLLLPTVEFVAWDDERMVRTIAAVREELDVGGGLLRRYARDDGLPGREGAFLCCSFWLVEALARAGQVEEAQRVYGMTIAKASPLGLYSEELDPETDEMRGNYPQGLTHLSHISAVVALSGREVTAGG